MNLVPLPAHSTRLAWDELGSGPPLVLLHAFPLDRRMWLRQLHGLGELYRVIAVDLPGFGESGPPLAEPSVDRWAAVVADFLDALGVREPVALAGLSMGGYVAMALARQSPERLRALILADTKAEPDDEAAKVNRGKMARMAREHGSHAVIESMLPRMISDASRRQQPDLEAAVRALGAAQSPECVASALAALRDRPDATAGLQALNVPTLWVVGERDVITPPELASNLAARMPNARVQVIPDAGHLANMESPEAFNAAVRDFLAGLPGAGA